MAEEGKYIYCIIDTNGVRNFGAIGMGGRGNVVSNISYQEISAVISRGNASPPKPPPVVTRPMARDRFFANQLLATVVQAIYNPKPAPNPTKTP